MTFDKNLAGFHAGCGGKVYLDTQPNGLVSTLRCTKCTSNSTTGTLGKDDVVLSPYDETVEAVIAADLAENLAFYHGYTEE